MGRRTWLAAGLGASLPCASFSWAAQAMLALVAPSVSQELLVAEGHRVLSERQQAWSIHRQIPSRCSVTQFPHLYKGDRVAGPRGDRHLWAEDRHGTSPRRWHLALGSRAPGSVGPHPHRGRWCHPRRHQGQSGRCASCRKAGCSAAAAGCRGRAARVGDAEAEPVPPAPLQHGCIPGGPHFCGSH